MKHFQAFSMSFLFIFFMAFMLPVPAFAFDDSDIIELADANTIDDVDMENMRAGFADPTGLIFRFAVDVTTQIDGAITFTRSIVMMPDVNGQLAATSNATLTAQNLPSGTITNVINNGRGVEVKDSKGNTTVLNQTARGAMASVVINTANHRQVTQNMNINIVLQGVQAAMNHVNGATSAINGLAQSARMHNLGFGH